MFDEFLIIFLREITTDMAGRYTVRVSNMSGTAEGSCDLHISGVPSAPIGPLDVSEITSHTCQLSWQPPARDGGSRVTHYVVERRDLRHDHWIVVSSFCKNTSFTVQVQHAPCIYFSECSTL